MMPAETIVIDPSLTLGCNLAGLTANARPRSWLQICSGPIGISRRLPCAPGAGTLDPDPLKPRRYRLYLFKLFLIEACF